MSTRLPSFRRPAFAGLLRRVTETPRFIQVLTGPRQVGKTTLARQAIAESGLPAHYATADDPVPNDRTWLEAQWEAAEALADPRRGSLLVLDEVQKIPGWSETVKRLWDGRRTGPRGVRLMILGSSPLLLQAGMSESLAGRFEITRLGHWTYVEMHDAFGASLDRYVYFGGYPGAVPLWRDRDRWAAYINDALIETGIARDILLLTRVDKPALLRQLFGLSRDYSGQIVSYTKMLGQLQDAGNTTTLAHYLDLLGGAGMVCGLQKFSGSAVRQRGSSPKLLALNTALISSAWADSPADAKADPARWGRLVETAVGAHLIAALGRDDVFYWRAGNDEVDFVIPGKGGPVGIEVTAGLRKRRSGLAAFKRAFPTARVMIVGADGVPLETFLSSDPTHLTKQ